VKLIGCQGNACQNGGTCWPYLVDETIHKFNCTCPNGYHGEVCDYVSIYRIYRVNQKLDITKSWEKIKN
jgi:hypothetical protein